MKYLFKTNFYLALILSVFTFIAVSCEDDEDEDEIIQTRIIEQSTPKRAITINMRQRVNGSILLLDTTLSGSNLPYINEKGQDFNVTKLRYLISDISFHKSDGSSFTIDEYIFVDVSDESTLTYMPETKVPAGDYNRISFNFGFDREDNMEIYPDLNIKNWNWPSVGMFGNLGGGYHFMQLEGFYDSSGTAKPFATHMGTARNITGTDTTFEDNHFKAIIDTNFTLNTNFTINIVMNVEQWYENPYTWDFNVYNKPIMPVYDAQRKLNLNGPSVFTIE